MFSRLIQWLKGVIDRMFNRSQMQQITGQKIAITNTMLNRMDLWDRMLKGQAPWIDESKGITSLHLESAICREFANVALSEMDTSLPDEQLNTVYQNAVHSMNGEFQNALGLGSFAMKPLGNTGKYEFIPADRIIPLEYDSQKRLSRCAFVQVKMTDDTTAYYRVELHELVNNQLHIANRAFKGSISSIGSQISLTDVQEWADLPEDVTYPGMARMDFGYYRNPVPNRVDGSDNPVSIFEDAVEQIKAADKQFGRVDWEYESGERMVFGDYTIFQKGGKQQNRQGYRWEAPTGKERMFVGMDIDGDSTEPIKDHSPALRDTNYIAGLNEYKRQVEFNVCLAYGDMSKNEAVEKTATEIAASKNRKYNMVTAIQSNLETCLMDFAYALAFYMAKYSDDIGFECTFHDSIKTDEETERAQDRMDLAAGLLSKVDYRMKWYGEDEKTARAKIAEIQSEQPEEPLS